MSEYIGLIADSHGNTSALAAVLEVLEDRGADLKIHLGDIFDSLLLDRVLPIFRMMNAHDVVPVKGNNDHQIQKQLSNGHADRLSKQEKRRLVSYLQQMPMKIVQNDICFTHSLPYDTIRSFYEPVDTGFTDRALKIFENTPYRLLVCGHSHAPVLFRWREGDVTRETPPANRWIRLQPAERYIVIVGSSENGEGGLIGADNMHYQRITISLRSCLHQR